MKVLPHLPFCASDVDGIQSVQIRELQDRKREREHKGCMFVEREGEGGREGERASNISLMYHNTVAT